jgi:uncharacterized protein (DUF2267 family)
MNGKKLTRALGVVALTIGVVALETVVGRRLSRRLARAVTRAAHYQSGRLAGLRYRLSGRHPDPSVRDRVLADRVRSMLGDLEHRLDIPRVHVQVEDHEVLLHGDVGSDEQVEAIVDATRKVPGVLGVTSHLHVGLLPGDTRPSESTGHPAPSAALTRILNAAHAGGASEGSEQACARSVLSTFAALLPKGERRHVLTHLPTDLRVLAEPLRPGWAGHRQLRRLDEFTLAALPNIEPGARPAIVESVIGTLRALVPEESFDVAAVLPKELRPLWRVPVPG